jgi:hypothetical protein
MLHPEHSVVPQIAASGNNVYVVCQDDLDELGNTQKSVGLDPGFGSSAFGVCITELVDGVINVLHEVREFNPFRVSYQSIQSIWLLVIST